MKGILVLLAAVVLVGGGAVGGWFAQQETRDAETVTETTTTTVTTTETVAETSLPAAVAKTRDALLAAAESGEYESLRPLIPAGFKYTFGSPVPGGPIAYWQNLERTTSERPLAALGEVLQMPYTLSRGIYYWPFAYDIASIDDLTGYERTLLAPLGPLESVFVEGTGYLGWRAGIQPDGAWIFFVAGD